MECWDTVKTIKLKLPASTESWLITSDEEKAAQKAAKKDQKEVNNINAQVEVVKFTTEQWKRLSEFCVKNKMLSPTDFMALKVACKIPEKIPDPYQSKRLLALLKKAKEEGFNIN